MDRKNHNGILIFLVVLVFCFFIFVTYLKLTHNNSSNNTNNNQSSGNNEIEVETLDTHSELVQQLHNMVDIFDISIGTSKKYLGYYYLKDSYNVNEMDNEVKIALGINQVRNTTISNDIGKPVTINETDVALGIKKVFGDSATYQDTNLTDMIDCMLFNYDSTSNTYKGTWDGCGGVLLSSIESKVIKAIKIDDKIEITEKMAYFSYDETNKTYDVYSDAGGISLVANKFKYVKVLDTETDLLDSVISYYGSLLKLYKYTFTLGSDGNYHFTSVELVK